MQTLLLRQVLASKAGLRRELRSRSGIVVSDLQVRQALVALRAAVEAGASVLRAPFPSRRWGGPVEVAQ
ncbi:hypothetical protein ACWC4C_37865 [Streptomyces olivaceoviridis]